MDLKSFIEETLVEISDGIEAANHQLNKHEKSLYAKFILVDKADDKENSLINFDVAITTKSEIEGSTEGKFKLLVANAEISANGSMANEKISRVKFSVSAVQSVGYVVNDTQ